MKKKICMIVQDKMVKGGIASVVNGYRGSKLENSFSIKYVESYKDGNKLEKTIKAINGYLHFIKVILTDNPDIIHIHSSFGASFYRKIPFIYISNWFKKPIINHIHGANFDEFYIKANPIKKKLIEATYNKCSCIIALSQEWKNNLELIVSKEKIEIIENYSIIQKPEVISKTKEKLEKQILFLGEIGERKGCYDIPDVVEKVTKSIPDAKFVLGGSGEIKKIEELLCKKGIRDKVSFPGWVRGKDKDELLRESDIFFLPSYNEGMPMSILDAMGYGLPVVSTNVGGIPKIVKNNINGYICEPGEIDNFAEHIIYILKNRHILLNYRNNSYKIVKEKYSIDRHITMLEELYERIFTEK